ncbi:hypothetical protein I3F60_18930 [Streptomyces sp. MUM 136J]|uniref:CAP domain-containing protein n=1 Tax=Streptomyces sp. MUM 136J TaxID=2791992 RepID=UPI001F03AA0D|nr:CAP domain-containing protein [Streptomyces sp. MUM 136J]MCH0571312.1 hypothetical protein [Streptomyces sp. MUM 136J]
MQTGRLAVAAVTAFVVTAGAGYALMGHGDGTHVEVTTREEAAGNRTGEPLAEASVTSSPHASASRTAPASASVTATAKPARTGSPSVRPGAGADAERATPTPRASPTRRTATPRPTPTAGAAAPGSPATGTAAALAREVLQLTNEERAKAGCAPLRTDSRLQTAAQAHADDMAARDYYEHDTPEGKAPGDRMQAAGYDWRKWGENIHRSPKDARTAVRDWMNSPAHRDNILDCGFKDLGVGVNLSANGPWWVQDFGTLS